MMKLDVILQDSVVDLIRDGYNVRSLLRCHGCGREVIDISFFSFESLSAMKETSVLPADRCCTCDRARCRIGALFMRKSGRVISKKRDR